MFESASSLKNEFDQRFGDLAPLPIDPADLAIRCEQFIDIRKSESVNVEVARTFIFKELQLAKNKQDEAKVVEIHKVIRDMDEVKEGDALGV
jgi:hypothetical protein